MVVSWPISCLEPIITLLSIFLPSILRSVPAIVLLSILRLVFVLAMSPKVEPINTECAPSTLSAATPSPIFIDDSPLAFALLPIAIVFISVAFELLPIAMAFAAFSLVFAPLPIAIASAPVAVAVLPSDTA